DGTVQLAYTEPHEGYHGFLAPSGGSLSQTEALAMPLADATLMVGADGALRLLAYDGAFGISLWTHTATESQRGAALPPGGWFTFSNSAAMDDRGCAWEAGFEGADAILLRYQQDWSSHRLWRRPGGRCGIALALDAGGRPHVVGWAALDRGGFALQWSEDGSAPESIATSDRIAEQIVHLGVTRAPDGSGQPHPLFERARGGERGGQAGVELAYATRTGAAWTTTAIDGVPPAMTCGTPMPQATCAWDQRTLWPLAVVTSGTGDVRLIYRVERTAGTLRAMCS